MELIDCPHCGGTVNAIFELCPRCGKGLRRDWTPDIEAAKARAKAKKAATLAAESPENIRAANYGCLALVALAVICLVGGLIAIFNSGKPAQDAVATSTSQDSLKFNGHCEGLLYAVDELTSVLAGAGDTSTVEDVRTALKENGELFIGYAALVDDPDQAMVLQAASDEMLNLRVVLTDGGDYKKPTLLLKSDFTTIEAICNS